MVFGLISHPTKAFEDAFSRPKLGAGAAVILLTAIFSALAGFVFFGNQVLAGYLFASSIIQWIVFSLIVWFFGFVHTGKKRSSAGTKFSNIASVTTKLWSVNLIGAFLLLVMALVLAQGSNMLLLVVFVVALILAIVLFIAWLIGSIKMLKVVTGAKRGRLIINWIILIVLNGILWSFIALLITNFVLI